MAPETLAELPPELQRMVAGAVEASLERLLGPAVAAAMRAAGRPEVRATTWTEALAKLKSIFGPPAKARATWAKHRSVLDRVTPLTPAGPAAIGPETVQSLIEAWTAEGLASCTQDSYLRTLRAQCRALVKLRWLSTSPWDLTEFDVRPEPGRVVHYSRDEVARVLRAADRELAAAHPLRRREKLRAGRLRALVCLLAYTGLRAAEALCLRWEDLDRAGRTLLVGPGVAEAGLRTKTKAAKALVPVPDACWLAMEEWGVQLDRSLPGCRWLFPAWSVDSPWIHGSSSSRPLGQVAALGRRCGVANLTLRGLRHTWATHAESWWGLSKLVIRRVLRHTDDATQEHYRHFDAANLRAQVAGLSYGERGAG